MKRLFLIIISTVLILSGCSNSGTSSKNENPTPAIVKTEFSKGVWISYNEINSMLKSENGFKAEFDTAVGNLKNLGITDLYFHIRSHCDSVVKSEYFPQTESSLNADFDILQYVTDICHKENIKVHGWINPYRVTASHSDITLLPQDSPVAGWLGDEKPDNDINVIINNGIYLNPACAEVRQLIVNGIKELIANYQLDGIHFDDYFYPTTDPDFDRASYDTYKSGATFPLSQDDWRRANVDALITDSKTAISLSGKDIVFSVSPFGGIEKDYNSYYADVENWCKNSMVDEIIPQLYFGFNHTDPDFKFENLLACWTKLCKNSKVKLKIGLAPYKIGTSSPTDGDEWLENTDIISRQTEICFDEPTVFGVCYFSYDSLFSEVEQNRTERNNLINVLKNRTVK